MPLKLSRDLYVGTSSIAAYHYQNPTQPVGICIWQSSPVSGKVPPWEIYKSSRRVLSLCPCCREHTNQSAALTVHEARDVSELGEHFPRCWNLNPSCPLISWVFWRIVYKPFLLIAYRWFMGKYFRYWGKMGLGWSLFWVFRAATDSGNWNTNSWWSRKPMLRASTRMWIRTKFISTTYCRRKHGHNFVSLCCYIYELFS